LCHADAWSTGALLVPKDIAVFIVRGILPGVGTAHAQSATSRTLLV
jgi:hypothetical protein